MSTLKDILRIVLALSAIGLVVWLYLTVVTFLDQWSDRTFGWSIMRRRNYKTEIQTLFHGNTKDEDQL
ncbi:MAG: hypothetical protein ACLPHP_19050 [Candidatus Sulfotelmatobacter sp.]